MPTISYHASHEQFGPNELLHFIKLAEAAGFTGIHASDHFHPWSVRQGNSSFGFTWLGAAMEQCSLPFSMSCSPGQRMHPAVVAQAIATLAVMYPGRISFELGSGSAINEGVTGDYWPSKGLRNERLLQCKHVITELLSGKLVNFSGLVKTRNARLFTLPQQIPDLFCAASSESTAAWAGTWADGLFTEVDNDLAETESRIRAFRSAAGNYSMPVHLYFSFSYGRNWEEAANQAHDQWRSKLIPEEELSRVSTPEELDRLTATITRKEVVDQLPIITTMKELKFRIQQLSRLNPSGIHLNNVSRNQETYLEDISSIL